jgi:hypothetical protein
MACVACAAPGPSWARILADGLTAHSGAPAPATTSRMPIRGLAAVRGRLTVPVTHAAAAPDTGQRKS